MGGCIYNFIYKILPPIPYSKIQYNIIKKRGEYKINKYIGTYYIYFQENSDGSLSKNKDDNYLLGKASSQCYRYDELRLAIYFPSGVSTSNIVIPKLLDLGVDIKLFLDCDGENVYIFNEKDIEKVHSVLHFQIKGKNQQLKDFKAKQKADKLKQKQDKINIK